MHFKCKNTRNGSKSSCKLDLPSSASTPASRGGAFAIYSFRAISCKFYNYCNSHTRSSRWRENMCRRCRSSEGTCHNFKCMRSLPAKMAVELLTGRVLRECTPGPRSKKYGLRPRNYPGCSSLSSIRRSVRAHRQEAFCGRHSFRLSPPLSVQHAHSYRNASTGSSRAARNAG